MHKVDRCVHECDVSIPIVIWTSRIFIYITQFSLAEHRYGNGNIKRGVFYIPIPGKHWIQIIKPVIVHIGIHILHKFCGIIAWIIVAPDCNILGSNVCVGNIHWSCDRYHCLRTSCKCYYGYQRDSK